MGSSIGSAAPAKRGARIRIRRRTGVVRAAFSISNTTLIGGAAVRIEDRDKRLVGATNNDPNRCGRLPDPSGQSDGFLWYQVCQGLFKDQIHPAQRLATAPGMASLNFDQGNLNYEGHYVSLRNILGSGTIPEVIHHMTSGRYFITALADEDKPNDYTFNADDAYFEAASVQKRASK